MSFGCFCFLYFFVFILCDWFFLLLIYYWLDLVYDLFVGLCDCLILLRCFQVLFMWFICSEIFLFLCIFLLVFVLLFIVCDFVVFCFVFPILFSFCFLGDIHFCCFFYYCDLFNCLWNCVLLFCSGIFCNVFLLVILCRCFFLCMFYLFFGLFLGVLFLCNQYYEFCIGCVTLSCTCFGSSFLLIELLHFVHVFLGVLFLFVLYARCFCFFLTGDCCLCCLFCGY